MIRGDSRILSFEFRDAAMNNDDIILCDPLP